MGLIENIRLRWKLRKVCRKLGIKPYSFQRKFALKGRCKLPRGRVSGKTMAIMLYGLIRDMSITRDVYELSEYDPDTYTSYHRRDWFVREYYNLWKIVNGDNSETETLSDKSSKLS